MVDEDFTLGYCVGYNDGVSSGGGGSGGSLDDYPVFPKKFRFGDSDFYFLVGDINTGFYDSLESIRYDSTAGAYSFNNATWYRCLCIILCKGEERFAVFNLSGSSPTIHTSPVTGKDGVYSTTTYYIDSVSCAKVTPSSSTGQWRYNLTCNSHYDVINSDGSYSYTGTTTFSNDIYRGLYFNADGTVKSTPNQWVCYTQTFRCLNDGYYAELMNLMLTVPDIIEEVF